MTPAPMGRNSILLRPFRLSKFGSMTRATCGAASFPTALRRWPAIALAAAVLVMTAACGSSRPTQRVIAQGEASNGDEVPVRGLQLSGDGAAATARNGGAFVAIDGLNNSSRDHPSMRVWLGTVDEPGKARVIDVEDLGPRSVITAIPWGSDFAIASGYCPTPVQTTEDLSFLERCGATDWDVITIDSTSGKIGTVLSGISLESREILTVVAATDTDLLVREGKKLVAVTRDGNVRLVDQPVFEETTEATSICILDKKFVAITPVPFDYVGPNRSKPRALTEYVQVSRLTDNEWKPLVLPTSPIATKFASVLGCTKDGVVMQSIDVAMDGLEVGESLSRLFVLGDSTAGGIRWTELPTETLPVSANGIRDYAVIDGRVAAATLSEKPRRGAEVHSSLFIWNGSSWVAVSDSLGEWGVYGLRSTPQAILVSRETQVMRLEQTGNRSEISIED